MYYYCWYLVQTYLIDLLKSVYHDPRPFWASSSVLALDSCLASYGNPSGHSLMSVSFGFLFILEMFYSKHNYRVLEKMRHS